MDWGVVLVLESYPVDLAATTVASPSGAFKSPTSSGGFLSYTQHLVSFKHLSHHALDEAWVHLVDLRPASGYDLRQHFDVRFSEL